MAYVIGAVAALVTLGLFLAAQRAYRASVVGGLVLYLVFILTFWSCLLWSVDYMASH